MVADRNVAKFESIYMQCFNVSYICNVSTFIHIGNKTSISSILAPYIFDSFKYLINYAICCSTISPITFDKFSYSFDNLLQYPFHNSFDIHSMIY